jgi:hypothetical protein
LLDRLQENGLDMVFVLVSGKSAVDWKESQICGIGGREKGTNVADLTFCIPGVLIESIDN